MLYMLPDVTFASINPIDVVFVCHPKDKRTLDLAINGIRDNGKDIRRIIVVSESKLTDQAEWCNENIYPFNKKSIALEIFDGNEELANTFINKKDSRIGWIYQQFLKIYAVFVIPDISNNVLIIDADTVFLNPVSFIDDTNTPLFNPGTEYNKPYFEHAAKLLPGFKKIYPEFSGISHHMLFQRNFLEEIFNKIESAHKIETWRAACRFIDKSQLDYSCMCVEYELYFNYMFSQPDRAKIRPLKWVNTRFSREEMLSLQKNGFHYASFHTYII